jgi:hypothetical protein
MGTRFAYISHHIKGIDYYLPQEAPHVVADVVVEGDGGFT